jgi:hypothetical protein
MAAGVEELAARSGPGLAFAVTTSEDASLAAGVAKLPTFELRQDGARVALVPCSTVDELQSAISAHFVGARAGGGGASSGSATSSGQDGGVPVGDTTPPSSAVASGAGEGSGLGSVAPATPPPVVATASVATPTATGQLAPLNVPVFPGGFPLLLSTPTAATTRWDQCFSTTACFPCVNGYPAMLGCVWLCLRVPACACVYQGVPVCLGGRNVVVPTCIDSTSRGVFLFVSQHHTVGRGPGAEPLHLGPLLRIRLARWEGCGLPHHGRLPLVSAVLAGSLPAGGG